MAVDEGTLVPFAVRSIHSRALLGRSKKQRKTERNPLIFSPSALESLFAHNFLLALIMSVCWAVFGCDVQAVRREQSSVVTWDVIKSSARARMKPPLAIKVARTRFRQLHRRERRKLQFWSTKEGKKQIANYSKGDRFLMAPWMSVGVRISTADLCTEHKQKHLNGAQLLLRETERRH